MNKYFEFNINPLICHIGKEPDNFTKRDIIDFVIKNDIRIVNFRYVAMDGRLKTLNFPITNYQYLDSILSYGERVDGSSLFPYIEAGSSDLYVIPRFSTAYMDPFAETPTLGLLCSYFTKDGLPLESSPEYTLRKAHNSFHRATGFRFEAMGELEFYLIDTDDNMFPIEDQKGYHESSPFTKFESFRTEAMRLIAQSGGNIKYGHSEVGNFTLDGKIYEQNEIEFLVNPVESAADQLLMAKWILRTLAYRYGIDITFSPKITEGKAGSGLHFHTRIMKGDQSGMIENGRLSDTARTAIAGYMKCAAALTAFGNTNPTSYFRLVPHQEAPTSVCWGDRNRSVLVRVPLGWTGDTDMLAQVNPLEGGEELKMPNKQTVEMRSPDGSADIYNMMAGLVVAARTGFEMADALKVAESTYVDVNIHDKKNETKLNSLEQLPSSCHESAMQLERNRAIFEAEGVFAPTLIDGTINALRKFDDANIREEIKKHPAMMMDLVRKYYHCG
ncbi:MAG: glutamine synthetase family protein [Bacteroidales bacterium]